MYFYGIGSSVTSIVYNNFLPDVIWTHILNPPVWCNITYMHIFETFNLFIPFSIGIDSPCVFCGTPHRLVWFVSVGIGGHLGSSRQWRSGFRHVAPWRMRVTLNSVCYNTSSCKDPPVGSWLPSSVISEAVCFKWCIYGCMVKSFFVWDATYPFTLGLLPGFTLNGIFYYTSFCTHPTVGFWLPRIVVDEVVCFKGCISRCAVKSSGVWEATHLFTSGLHPGVTLNGVFYNMSSCTHWTVCTSDRRSESLSLNLE